VVKPSDTCLSPQPVVDALLRLWPGGPDLDPCAHPQQIMPAKRRVTLPQDGLEDEWAAGGARTVFVNPPYSRGQVMRWVLRAASYAFRLEVLLLVRQDTGTGWAREARRLGCSFCFATSRYHFDDWADVGQSAKFSSMYLFFGPNAAAHRRFCEAFATEGVVAPCQRISSWVYADPMDTNPVHDQASAKDIIDAWMRTGAAEVLDKHWPRYSLGDLFEYRGEDAEAEGMPLAVLDQLLEVPMSHIAWVLRNLPAGGAPTEDDSESPAPPKKGAAPKNGKAAAPKAAKVEAPAPAKKGAAPKKLAPPAPAKKGDVATDDESAAGQAARDAAVLAAVRDIGSKTGEGAARSDLLEATGVGENALRRSLERLLNRSQVARKGERRWARYYIA